MRLDPQISLIGGGRLGPGISNDYDANIYLIHLPGGAWLVDAGCGLEPDRLLRAATEAAGPDGIEGVLVTHSHPDHAGGAAAFGERGVPVLAGSETVRRMAMADPAELGLDLALHAGIYPAGFTVRPAKQMLTTTEMLPVNETPGVGHAELTAHATPGHSADHTAYLLDSDRRYLFTGDLVFSRGRVAVLATPDTNPAAMHRSLRKLRALEPDVLLPGHGVPVMNDAGWHLDQALAAFEVGRLPPNLT